MSATSVEDPTTVPHGQDETNGKNDQEQLSFEDAAPWWHLLFLTYLNPLFDIGVKRPIELADLGHASVYDRSARLYYAFEAQWQKERLLPHPKRSLWLVLWRTVGYSRLVKALSYYLLYSIQSFGPVLILNSLVRHFEGTERLSTGMVWFLVVMIFLLPMIGSVLAAQSNAELAHVGVEIRNALISAIYRKALRLSPATRQQASTGQVVNMFSNDTQQLQRFMFFINNLFTAPLIIAVAIVLIYLQVGVATFVGLALIILVFPLNGRVFTALRNIRKDKMLVTDRRVKLMNEILNGIRIIKYYAWEYAFEQRVLNIRTEEVKLLRKNAYLIAVAFTFVLQAVPTFLPVLVFLTYIFLGNQLDAATAFTAISLFNLIQFPFVFLPMGLTQYFQTRVSNDRILRFLDAEEVPDYVIRTPLLINESKETDKDSPEIPDDSSNGAQQNEEKAIDSNSSSLGSASNTDTATAAGAPQQQQEQHQEIEIVVSMRNASLCWTADTAEGDAGEAGAEEGETPTPATATAAPAATALGVNDAGQAVETRIEKDTHPAHAPAAKYTRIDNSNEDRSSDEHSNDEQGGDTGGPVEAQVERALVNRGKKTLVDMNFQLQRGQLLAVVGSVGSGKSSILSALLGEMRLLSGEVQLCGSVAFCDQRPWILNDTVQNNVTFGLPYDAERFDLALHAANMEEDLVVLPGGVDTQIGERGINLSGGQKARVALARAIYRDADVYLLDDPLSAVDAHVGQFLFHEALRTVLSGKTRILVTHQVQYLPYCDNVLVVADGSVKAFGTFDELQRSGIDIDAYVPHSSSSSDDNNNNDDDDDKPRNNLAEGTTATAPTTTTTTAAASTTTTTTTGNTNQAVLPPHMRSTSPRHRTSPRGSPRGSPRAGAGAGSKIRVSVSTQQPVIVWPSVNAESGTITAMTPRSNRISALRGRDTEHGGSRYSVLSDVSTDAALVRKQDSKLIAVGKFVQSSPSLEDENMTLDEVAFNSQDDQDDDDNDVDTFGVGEDYGEFCSGSAGAGSGVGRSGVAGADRNAADDNSLEDNLSLEGISRKEYERMSRRNLTDFIGHREFERRKSSYDHQVSGKSVAVETGESEHVASSSGDEARVDAVDAVDAESRLEEQKRDGENIEATEDHSATPTAASAHDSTASKLTAKGSFRIVKSSAMLAVDVAADPVDFVAAVNTARSNASSHNLCFGELCGDDDVHKSGSHNAGNVDDSTAAPTATPANLEKRPSVALAPLPSQASVTTGMKYDVRNLMQLENAPTFQLHRERSTQLALQRRQDSRSTVINSKEEKQEGNISAGAYGYYFTAGGIGLCILMIIFIIASQAFMLLGSYWLAFWGAASRREEADGGELSTQRNIFYLVVFAALSFLSIFCYLLRSLSLANLRLNASIILQKGLLSATMHATVAFFDVTPVGRVLNRFTSDLNLIDEELASTLSQLSNSFAQVLGAVGAVAGATKGTFLIMVLPLGYFYNHIQKYFRATNTTIARIEAISRSPIYADFSQALNGITTIRAYSDEQRFIDGLERTVDCNTAANVMQQLASQWLSIRLDVIGASVSFFVAMMAAATAGTGFIPAGFLALGLTYSFMLTTYLKFAVRMIASAESQMSSVERVKYYMDHIEQEDDVKDKKEGEEGDETTAAAAAATTTAAAGATSGDVEMGVVAVEGDSAVSATSQKSSRSNTGSSGRHRSGSGGLLGLRFGRSRSNSKSALSAADLPPDWPAHGAIEGRNVQLRYRDGPLVLKGLNFSIKAGQKIGIAGRTGSGKSSLMVGLFRIEELAGGTIYIDGVDASRVPLSLLRSRLGIIPQDPVMFSASVRFNLDPFQEHSDARIWEVLESIHIKDHIMSMPNQLDEMVAEGGDNFSAGQRQLVCIARALLRNPKILIMDEATASIDNETDSLVQRMIREQFKQSTVLTIAHRLHTIMDSDQIMVMEDGLVGEIGPPELLLADSSGDSNSGEASAHGNAVSSVESKGLLRSLWDQHQQSHQQDN